MKAESNKSKRSCATAMRERDMFLDNDPQTYTILIYIWIMTVISLPIF